MEEELLAAAAAADEEGKHEFTMNVHQAMPESWIGDMNARLAIINVLHQTGWNVYEEQAVNSLRNAYPRFFRSDS